MRCFVALPGVMMVGGCFSTAVPEGAHMECASDGDCPPGWACVGALAKGRDNWLFAGNDEAAEKLANLLGICSTCEANGINPEAYLADVLPRLATHPAKDLDELLPHRLEPSASMAEAIPTSNSKFEIWATRLSSDGYSQPRPATDRHARHDRHPPRCARARKAAALSGDALPP